MSFRSLRRGVFVILSFLLCFNAWAKDEIFSWDFSDCLIREILYVVSLDSGVSIVPDDTVSGKGDFRFTGKDFESAFDAFLGTARLFVSKKADIWTVSKFKVYEKDGLFFLDAYDLTAEQIMEKLALNLGVVITYESLPGGVLNVHFSGLTENELMEKIGLRLGSYEVRKLDNGFHFEKKNDALKYGINLDLNKSVVKKNQSGGYSVDIKDAKFSDVLEQLFLCEKQDEEKSFCMLLNGEQRISRSCFSGSGFEETLRKLCVQNNADFFVSDGIYYIVADNKARENLCSENLQWRKIILEYEKAERCIGIISKRFGKLEYIILPDERSFLIRTNETEFKEIENLVKDIDVKLDLYLIELKFIKPQEFVKYLPPDIDRNSVYFADDDSKIYYKGSEASYKTLCEQMKICDRPVVRLSYDLLILQYDEGMENSWNPGFSVKSLQKGDRNSVGLKLGNSTSLNMSFIGAFGLNFAAQLQSSIEENKTKVFADTTLHGVSGKMISFQNTNTYRYRDNNLDPDTGKPVYSGITKEIVSGLKLDVCGFVSGDGMITSSVVASVTRQGNDTSSATGNPPPTSEKVVTTEVCGKSGEPIIISGLIQNSDLIGQNRSPLISKIPLFGWLFKHQEKISEKNQMVIYLIPHIEEYNSSYLKNTNERETEEWMDAKCKLLINELKEMV